MSGFGRTSGMFHSRLATSDIQLPYDSDSSSTVAPSSASSAASASQQAAGEHEGAMLRMRSMAPPEAQRTQVGHLDAGREGAWGVG